jgi:hypothetical protein
MDKSLFIPEEANHIYDDFTLISNLKKQMEDNQATQNLESGSENLDKVLKILLVLMFLMNIFLSGGLIYMI